MQQQSFQFLSVFLIVFSVVSVWFKSKHTWWFISSLFIVQGFFFGVLQPVALVFIFALVGLLYWHKKNNGYDWLSFTLVVTFGLLLGTHSLSGFNNWYYADYKLSETVNTFSIWFNFDKIIFGFLVLSILFKDNLINSRYDFVDFSKKFLPIFLVGVSIIFIIGYVIGYVVFDFTWTTTFFIWALKNLFFTVIAEEVMFRGIIQAKLVQMLGGVWGLKGQYVAVLIASILFGLAHYNGGLNYVILSSMAGVLYGYIYLYTGKIEGAILSHFLLNTIHFVFFSYPFHLV